MSEFCLVHRMRILKAINAGTSKNMQYRNSQLAVQLKGSVHNWNIFKVKKKKSFLVELNLGQDSHGLAGATFCTPGDTGVFSPPQPCSGSRLCHPHPAHNTYLFVANVILPQEGIAFVLLCFSP